MICMASTKARDELVLENLGLVYFVAQRMVKINPVVRQYGYDDAVSYCQSRMLTMADRYDAARGKFSTYYVTFMQRELVREASRWYKTQAKVLANPEVVEAPPTDSRYDLELVAILLGELPERSRDMVQRYYGLTGDMERQDQSEIAAHYGISKQRVFQIISNATEQMRKIAARRLKAKNAVAL